jgi:uncharacterized repeat protein (TIGR01451 family)
VVATLPHAFSADLIVTLTSPAGTTVTLTSRNGGESDNVFAGTLWDDGGLLHAGAGGAVDFPYQNGVVASPLSPEEALGAFLGEDPNGTWTLTVTDNFPADVGRLDGWDLLLSTGACDPGDLAVSLSSSPAPVAAGGLFAYAARVTNASAGEPQQATLQLPLPAGTQLVSASTSQGTCTSAVACDLGTVRPGSSADVVAVVRTSAPGQLTASASVITSPGDANAANDVATARTNVTGAAGPTPPGPAPGAGTDRTPPTLTQLVAGGQRLRAVQGHGLPALLAATEASHLRLRLTVSPTVRKALRLRSATIGSADVELSAAGSRRVTLKLTRAAARALAHRRSLRATLSTTATDAAGNASPAQVAHVTLGG